MLECVSAQSHPSQLLKNLAEFHKVWCKHFVTWNHGKLVIFHLTEQVIPSRDSSDGTRRRLHAGKLRNWDFTPRRSNRYFSFQFFSDRFYDQPSLLTNRYCTHNLSCGHSRTTCSLSLKSLWCWDEVSGWFFYNLHITVVIYKEKWAG